VGITSGDGIAQFVNNVRGRRLIWVTHTKINDVLTSSARGLLQLTYDVEDVGR
jgi:hypothetical protein